MIQIEVKILGSRGIIEPQPLRFTFGFKDSIIDLKSGIAEAEGYFPTQLILYFVKGKQPEKITDDKKLIEDFDLQKGFFLVEFPVCHNEAENRLSLSSIILVK